METKDINNPPPHLPEQMLYVLNRSIKTMMLNFDTWIQEHGVDYQIGYAKSFLHTFNDLRALVENMMHRKEACSLDPHKLASITMLSILNSRPILVKGNGERHSLNEIVAFYAAMNILRDYQADRLSRGDAALRKQLATDNLIITPEPSNSTQEVSASIIDSLTHLSKLIKTLDIRSANLVPILSVLMFYIDTYWASAKGAV